MMSLSKKCALIILFFHLCFSLLVVNVQTAHETNTPEFGDILVFPTSTCGVAFANHYAIYVDDVKMPGKKDGENLFHMTKSLDADGTSGCGFGTTHRVTFTVDNYLDDHRQQVNDQQTIINTINELNRNCGTWSWSNTCEHVATHIRYGAAYKQCNQHGTLFGSLVCQVILPIVNGKKRKRSLKGSKFMYQHAPGA